MNREGDQETLRKVLHEWHGAELPPRFQENVWREIDRKARRRPAVPILSVIAYWINTRLPQPALAVSYMTVLLAVGLTFGWKHASQQNARVKEEMSQRYVQVLDPNQTRGR